MENLRRPAGLLLALAATAAILWATLRHGDPAILEDTPFHCLVCGSSGGVDVWRNVVLFLPLGVALGLVGLRPARAALLGFLLSATVETLQATVLVGRAPSLSDIVTNTTGAALGAFLVLHWRAWVTPDAALARRLAVGAAAVWLAALALTAAGLRWSEPPPPYRLNQLPPTDGDMRAFEGVVHEAELDGEPVATGWLDRPVQPRGAGDTLRLRALVTPSYEPGKMRPVVWLHTPGWDQVLTFGQRRDMAVVRLRTASADARFSSPTHYLRGAFPPGVDTVEITAEVTRDGMRLTSTSGGGVRESRLPRRLSLGWILLGPQHTEIPFPALASAAWMAALVFPMAFWGARAGGRRRGAATASVAAFAVASLVAVGWMSGLAPPGTGDWLGIAAGVGAGWAASRVVARATREVEGRRMRRVAA